MNASERHRTLKGMQDILPPESLLWHSIELAARSTFAAYGFQEIRLPILEATGVFSRSIGEQTDIVEKEMYTFTDKGGRSVSLRPEGTASVVRSFVENNLHGLPAPQKFFYTGPMFRYERPQSGRFRQFYQIGAEAFSDAHPRLDAEIIAMLLQFLRAIGLAGLSVQLNSIGCEECRPGYRQVLQAFFAETKDALCPDCIRRFDHNPLRILDCKVERCRTARLGAPRITDHLCGACTDHFGTLRKLLDILGVAYAVNPEMVRGLDYYTRTTFEVTSDGLGSQNAVAAGGRYNRLVKEFGGPDTPAIGFAVGMERIAGLVRQTAALRTPSPAAFIAVLGEGPAQEGLRIAGLLRGRGYWIELGDTGSSLKSQMRRASRLSSQYVMVLGDEELASGSVTWKNLGDSSQGSIPIDAIAEFLADAV